MVTHVSIPWDADVCEWGFSVCVTAFCVAQKPTIMPISFQNYHSAACPPPTVSPMTQSSSSSAALTVHIQTSKEGTNKSMMNRTNKDKSATRTRAAKKYRAELWILISHVKCSTMTSTSTLKHSEESSIHPDHPAGIHTHTIHSHSDLRAI